MQWTNLSILTHLETTNMKRSTSLFLGTAINQLHQIRNIGQQFLPTKLPTILFVFKEKFKI